MVTRGVMRTRILQISIRDMALHGQLPSAFSYRMWSSRSWQCECLPFLTRVHEGGRLQCAVVGRAASFCRSVSTVSSISMTRSIGSKRIESRSIKGIGNDKCDSLREQHVSLSSSLPVPLHERDCKHTCSRAELIEFIEEAYCELSISSSMTHASSDDDISSLRTEFEWLIEDVICNNNTMTKHGTATDTAGECTCLPGPRPGCFKTWLMEIKDEMTSIESSSKSKHMFALRMSLPELKQLWGRRVPSTNPTAPTPFQYLVGCSFWRDLVLVVNEKVLIPRPETELLVDFAEEALQRFKDQSSRGGIESEDSQLLSLPWADVGTGSGCLAIALAKAIKMEREDMYVSTNHDSSESGNGKDVPMVYAIDLSRDALDVAKHNVDRFQVNEERERESSAERHSHLMSVDVNPNDRTFRLRNRKMRPNIRLLHGNLLNPIQEEKGLSLAGILSNPPYIPSAQIPSLQVFRFGN